MKAINFQRRQSTAGRNSRKGYGFLWAFYILFSISFIILSVCMVGEYKKTTRAYDRAALQLSPQAPQAKNPANQTANTPGVPQDWRTSAEKNLQAAEYHIHYQQKQGEYQSPNRAHNLRAGYRPGQLSMVTRKDSLQKEKWKLKLRTCALVFDGKESYYPSTEATIETREDTIDFHHRNLFTEEYINNKEGIRQNFIIQKAPGENTRELRIHMRVSGLSAKQVSPNEIYFARKTGKDTWENKISYKDLKAWDACGTPLVSSMEAHGNTLALVVNTDRAVFPVTIDPISTTVSTQLESNQASANLGICVSSAGDVNGDGYSDVIVGAWHYDNGQTDEGAAFVYHGSASGITTTIQTQLEVNQASALFGHWVSTAGDVNGDGYSDVIVSARDYTNGEATEGAAFVFHGSASGITTTIQTQLETNQAGADVYCVSSAGDVNGDGYSDVLVASRFYDNGQADEGAVFIYHGSASGITTTIRSQLEVNQAGAHFGAAAASAGDVNGDGYSDVIVGADVYANGQAGEGAAFIFLGSSAGISTTVSTQLEVNQASASFGGTVSSAGDVNGDGYSDVIVGSYGYSNGQSGEGGAFVFHGSAAGITTTIQTQLETNQASAHVGRISSAGDVNGDGYSDVMVSSSNYANGQADEGVVFIYLGSSTGISTTISTQLEVNQASAEFGMGVASAGDVNGDGYSDVIVGAWQYDNGQTDEGAAFIFLGSPSGINTTVSTQLERNQAAADIGFCVASAGDVNGDGYSDVIVGADTYDNGQTDEGGAFIYHGSASGISTTVSTQLESNQISAHLGYSVACAGDVNGDGYSDVIVGAWAYDNALTDQGAAFVYHGSASGITTTIQTWLQIAQATAQFGYSVASAGDVNGDGYSDVIVGANYYDNGQTNEGAAFIYHGSSTGITTTLRTQLEINQSSADFGVCVACAGDVNGDGYSDVIVGADFYTNGQTSEGGAFVFHGSASGITTTIQTQLEKNLASAQFGLFVASAGDVNGDGYSDVIIGAPFYTNGQTSEGGAFVYHGSSTGITTTLQTQLECNQASAQMGYCVASAGDVNGDGYSDVIVGIPYYDNGQTDEGAAFIYYGSSAGVTTTLQAQLESNVASSSMGFSVASAGDVNGDGYSDIILGAPFYTNGQSNEGAAFVYLGNKAASSSKRNNLRLYNSDLSTAINQNNRSSTTFGAGLFSKSFLGRVKGKLVWEVKTQGSAFSSGSNLTNSISSTSSQGSLTDLGIAGTELKSLITKPGKETKIRVRTAYSKVTAITGQVYSPWIYIADYQAGKRGMSVTPLPVELVSFDANPEEEKVRLQWLTASEFNNDYFNIEKSRDEKNWVFVTKVKGAGNSNASLFYNAYDNSPYSGISYYRLKQVDFNGAFHYSNTVSVEFPAAKSENFFNVYPALSSGDFNFSLSGSKDKEVLVVVRNLLGQEYYAKGFVMDNDSFVQSLNLSGILAPGIYTVIASSNNRMYAKKIVIR